MNINSLSLLYKTVHVTPQVMRMLVELLERDVTRDDPEWAAAMASLKVSKKIKIMPSRRQHKENERDCSTKVQQLVSSIPQNVLTSTSYKRKEQVKVTQKKSVTFMIRIRKPKRWNKTWDKRVCPGRRLLMRTGEFINNTRDKQFCPGSQLWKKMFKERNKTWRIKFCPGSSDG